MTSYLPSQNMKNRLLMKIIPKVSYQSVMMQEVQSLISFLSIDNYVPIETHK